MSQTVINVLTPWGPVQSILFDLDSDLIQQIVTISGMAPNWNLTNSQAYSNPTRKRVFRERIERCFTDLEENDKKLFIINVVRELKNLNPDNISKLNNALLNIGWIIVEDELVKLEILNPFDLDFIPVSAKTELAKSADRIPKDLSGAITSACGAIDSICREIYKKHGIDGFNTSSFQEKVKKSLAAIQFKQKLRRELENLGWEAGKLKIFIDNFEGAINQSANVMQTLRTEMSDAHGSKPVLATIAFDSLKWAMINNFSFK